MAEIWDILCNLDWSPLIISLKTGIVATIICFFLGVWAARGVLRLRPRAKALCFQHLPGPSGKMRNTWKIGGNHAC